MLDADLREKLDTLCRRQQRVRTLHAVVRGLVAGTLGYGLIRLALLLIAGVAPPLPLWIASVAVALLGAVTHRTPAFTRLDAARYADRQLALSERLGTAVEFSGPGAPASPLIERLHRDAAQHGEAVDPERLIPYKPPRELIWLLPALVFALGASLPQEPPALPWRSPTATQSTQRIATEEIDALRQLAERLLEQGHASGAQELLRLAEGLSDLADRAEQGLVSAQDFQDELSLMEDQLGAALASHGSAGPSPAQPMGASPEAEGPSGSQGDPSREAGAQGPREPDAEGEPGSPGEGSEEGNESDSHGSGSADQAVLDADGDSPGDDLMGQGDSDTTLPSDIPGQGDHAPGDDGSLPPGSGEPGGSEPGSDGSDESRDLNGDGETSRGERLDLQANWGDGTPFVVPHSGMGTGGERERLPFAGGFDAQPTPGDEVGVAREEIPPAYRYWVQRYFDQLGEAGPPTD